MRKGFSIVELMAVMTGVSVVLGGAIVLMQFMLGISGDVRDRTHNLAVLGRLAEQFRRDGHAARGEPRVAADHRTVQFDLRESGTVDWGIDDRGDVCRRENAGSKASRRNTYRLPKDATATFALERKGPAAIIALQVESPNAAGPSLAIDAFVGRDRAPLGTSGRLAEEKKK